MTPGSRCFDLDALRRDLVARADILFRECWGDPQNPHAARWRPARRKLGDDPRRMVMQGPQRGLWYDSLNGRGGDVFDFIAAERLGLDAARRDFPRVIMEASCWLGAPPTLPIQPPPWDMGALISPAPAFAEELDAVLAVAEPLTGRALRYWVETRGLDPPPIRTVLRLPAKALSRRPRGSPLPFADREAVLVLGRDCHGTIRAMQRILLAHNGIERDPDLPKFSLGPIGSFPPVFAPRRRDAAQGILVFAEGPETAGAIWSATGARVLVCGGGLARRVRGLTPHATVILAVEADAFDSPAARAITRAVAEARATGAVIGLLHCGGPPGSGYDAADLIREDGGRSRLRRLVADLADRLHRRRRR